MDFGKIHKNRGENMEYTIVATSTFGIEAITAMELRNLGYTDLKVENGKVEFKGTEKDIARCNLWLRTADRVHIKMAEYKAETFEELFQGARAVPWGKLIPANGKMHVTGKSVKSKLFSVPDCQAIVKKAVVESMKSEYKKEWFPEDGPVYKIEVGLLKDVCTLLVDTSGAGLHKRGYRETAGEAPLKETLAASMVLISRWRPERVLADPMCGSGTIPIEAAMIGKNMAPGLKRSFVSEDWPGFDKSIWEEVRHEAQAAINDKQFRILASDVDGELLKTARENALKAGVDEFVAFQKLPVQQFQSRKRYGCIICNPPYGERLMDNKEVERLYKDMGRVFTALKDWSYFILTAHPEFEKCFGRKADKNRKLYNGRLQCYYYQYLGPLPPLKHTED